MDAEMVGEEEDAQMVVLWGHNASITSVFVLRGK